MSDRTPDEFFSELHELAGANDPKQFIKDCFWLIYSYPDVCIFDAVEAQGKKYALAFDCSPMDHEDEEYASTGGFTLQCLSENAASTKYSDQNGWPGEDSDWTTISIPGTEDEQDNGTSSGGKSIEAVFMPLGWLVEIDTQSSPPQRYVTNYSVLLNLSTKSVSLWLAYDYHPKDEDDILTTRTLSPSHIVNPAYHPYDPCPKLNQNGPFQGSEFKLVEKPAFRQQFLGASRVPLLKSQQVQRRPSNIQWHTDNSAVIARAKLLRLYGGTLLAENISDLFEIFGKASVHENAHTLLQQPYFNLLLPNERELVKIYTQVGTGQELRARLKKERESALVEKRTPCYGKRRFDKPGNHKEFPYELKMSGSGWEDDVIEQQSEATAEPRTGEPNTPSNFDPKLSSSSELQPSHCTQQSSSSPFNPSNPKSSDTSEMNPQSFAGSEQSAEGTTTRKVQKNSVSKEALEHAGSAGMLEITGFDGGINPLAHTSEADTPTDTNPCKERGFLGLPQPWDLAVLTYDIGQWNKNGLKLEDVQRSLEYTIMEAGPSLRARAVQDGIDLKQSGFLTKLGR